MEQLWAFHQARRLRLLDPDPRAARLEELRARLGPLVRAIQEPGLDPRQKSMLAAEYERTLGAVFALGDELEVEPD
ncbi:hypothetical protein [Synechococcus sp. 1G10]|uniref:hypothetical protein n=1 Tax=Synechococcus sp. 1G10 TaxID=2025605 RepID=UPI000B98435A|nr:hypothetical protein [Synechococcus sp. 1G10]